MAAYIAHEASKPNRAFVVATHSPELMNAPNAHVIEVRRLDGRLAVAPLGLIERRTLGELGLHPSDLLHRHRAILLVEGRHDELILNEMLGDELRRLRTEVLTLRGVNALTPSVCSFIFRYTQAHLFIMLDNLDTDRVAAVWTDAKLTAVSQGTEAAKSLVIERMAGKKVEERALREVLTAALEDDQKDRITPHGMSRPDILDYLAAEKLVPGKRDWTELRAEHVTQRNSSSKFKAFKSWLEKVHKADLTDSSIREAAQSIDEPPADFVRLLKTIEAITME